MTAGTPPLPDKTPPLPDRRRPRAPSNASNSNSTNANAGVPSATPSQMLLASRLANVSLSARTGPCVGVPSSPRDAAFTPLPWHACFDASDDVAVPSRQGVWRVYTAGFSRPVRASSAAPIPPPLATLPLPLPSPSPPPLVVVLLHGGGHGALSWALVTDQLKPHVAVLAFDARAHGHSRVLDDAQLDAATQVDDTTALLSTFFAAKFPHHPLPKLVICGHSMGGAIAVRLAAARPLPSLVGLVVIDVVEGTAMAALPHMSNWLSDRTRAFASVEKAIRYVTKAGFIRNVASARISVPPQICYSETDHCWVWRTALQHTERYWKGWFDGLSALFLSVPVAKLLILANVNRMDKDLMIAQMQGKFQNILIPSAGHTIHEDQPEQTARTLLDFLHRNLLIEHDDDLTNSTVFQQRRPIPPCC